MHVITTELGEAVPSPCICMVCELAPTPGAVYVNTERGLYLTYPDGTEMLTHLSGARLLCKGCIMDGLDALLRHQENSGDDSE